MSNNQYYRERAASDGNIPLFFGKHMNQKNMLVNVLRAADAAPTVLRGGEQMSHETAAFVDANNALIDDPSWVATLMVAPPLLSQPVSYLHHTEQAGDHYAATKQFDRHWGADHGAPAYNHYGHYPSAAHPAYGRGNSSLAYPMSSNANSYRQADSTTFNAHPGSIMPGLPFRPPPVAAQAQRRSHSPQQHQSYGTRRRSPPDLNPAATSFAPGASSHLIAHGDYPLANGYNLASFGGIVARRGAWNSNGGAASAPYGTPRNEARGLAGHQGRSGVGSDDVRNYSRSVSHASSTAINNDDTTAAEHENEDDETAEEEEHPAPSTHPPAPPAPIPRRRRGPKKHKGGPRTSCDECRRKHIKCVKPDPATSCMGCLKAHGGPKVCQITKAAQT
ncbi:hypothetical protein QM012_002629 [Aureobasidium pullulans]|uniref:Zn(2)-C6 fungal-type domain-containing protein n=1 Tax=Aureobasidium pullulans TaxID=5580 RepID=A0ABR0TA50_AURPU